MATESQNIMDAFYAAGKREEIKERNREFKKGALGYMGGLPGALYDIAGGLEAMNMIDTLKEGIASITDTRTTAEKVAEAFVEAKETEKEAKVILKAAGYDLDDYSTIQTLTSQIMGGENLVGNILNAPSYNAKLNQRLSGVRLTTTTNQGNKINYQLGNSLNKSQRGF